MAATAAKTAKSTIGLKDLVIAPLTKDDDTGYTYGDLQKVEGITEATIAPQNNTANVQYADDIEFDTLYPDPEITLTTKLVDLPLAIQSMVLTNTIDDNGVIVRNANDKPGYFAVGFKSEKADHKFRYVWFFKCRAKPISENYSSKQGATINRQTMSVEWTAIKRTNDGYTQVVADEGENGFTADKAATFLDTVYEPEFTSDDEAGT